MLGEIIVSEDFNSEKELYYVIIQSHKWKHHIADYLLLQVNNNQSVKSMNYK